eukprot:751585-Hanusia_phi.AAC.2
MRTGISRRCGRRTTGGGAGRTVGGVLEAKTPGTSSSTINLEGGGVVPSAGTKRRCRQERVFLVTGPILVSSEGGGRGAKTCAN